MRKVWKDGRIKIELSEEEENRFKNIVEKDAPSNKEIIELLKLIIEMLAE